MAASTSHIDHLPEFYNALFDFIHHLRLDGFSIGIKQYLNVQQLMVTLAADHQMPIDPKELQSFIGPILCTDPDEQVTFDRRYDQWVRQFRPKTSEDKISPKVHEDSPLSDDIQPTIAAVQQRETYWKKLFWFSGALIALLMTLTILYKSWESILYYGALSSVLVMVLILIWWLWWNYETRMFLSRRKTAGKVVTHPFFVEKPSDTPFQSLSFIHTAQEFRRHRVIETQELDIAATIERSIQQGGLVHPCQRHAKSIA
jgi:hypothetical protein